MNYQEIKKQSEEKRNQLHIECGLFWAFSNEQFTENKTPLKEGEKYVSIGHGGYLPKSNIDKLTSGWELIRKEENRLIKAEKMHDIEILSELHNYECFYVGDISEAYNVLKDKYTKERVLSVYRKNYKNAMVNN